MIKKIVTSLLVIVTVIAINPIGINADTTSDINKYYEGYKVQKNMEVKFLKQDGTYARNEWIHKVGHSPTWGNYDLWNFFGDDYLMKQGWFYVNGSWYYEEIYDGTVDYFGGIVINREIDGYFLGSDGAMIKNSWGTDINGYCYYAGSDGKILKNTTTPDGYKTDKNGRWIR